MHLLFEEIITSVIHYPKLNKKLKIEYLSAKILNMLVWLQHFFGSFLTPRFLHITHTYLFPSLFLKC